MVHFFRLYQGATSHPCFPMLYHLPFSCPSGWILLFLRDKQMALSSLGEWGHKNAGFVLCITQKKCEKINKKINRTLASCPAAENVTLALQ